MAEGDYDNLHHMRNDVRDAHTNSSVAKMLSYLALALSAIALATAVAAWNKANDALGRSEQAINRVTEVRQQQ